MATGEPARGGYLQRVASRAAWDAPVGMLRPRRLMYAQAAVPPDEPDPIVSSSTARPPATPFPGPRLAEPGAPLLPREQDEAATVPEPAPATVPARSPAASESGVDPEASPTADMTSNARTPAAVTRAPRAVEPAAATAVRQAPPARPRRTPPGREIPVTPDPLAVALTRAVRWTSADDRPAEPAAAAIADTERESGRPSADDARPGEGRPRPARTPPSSTAPQFRPPPREPLAPPVLAARAQPATAPRDRSVPATPAVAAARATAGGRFTGIHIGSVEVRIGTPAPQSPVATPAPRPAASSPAPLARGLTSSIGLRQG